MSGPGRIVEFRPGAGPFYDETDPGALLLPGKNGSYAQTADHASLDITGDIDIRVDVTLEDWNQAGTVLAGKWDGQTQRSWRFAVSAFTERALDFWPSADGAENTALRTSTVSVTPGSDGRLAVRVTLDVDNAGLNTTTFYTAPTIAGPWTQLGSTVNVAGVTSIFASTADVEVGTYNNGVQGFPFGTPYRPLRGTVHAFELRNGIAGTVVANPDFSGRAAGTAAFTDGAGRTWTLAGAARITEGRDFPWVSLSDRLLEASWQYGRDNELDTFKHGTGTVVLANEDRALDPEHTTGPWYGALEPRTPFRLRCERLWLRLPDGTGRDASTPDHPDLDVTGDLDVAVLFAPDDQTPASTETVVAKSRTAGNQRSWRLRLSTSGAVTLLWSADGATELSAASTVTLLDRYSPDGVVAVRATLDVDNGAGGNTVTFYTGPTASGPWTQLGAPVVQAGTTSIFASTAPLSVGIFDTGGTASNNFDGWVGEVVVRSGIGGAVVARPQFGHYPPGTTSFTDPAGRAWTLTGTAAIGYDATHPEDLFYGFVEGGFVPDYRPPAEAVCTIDLVDYQGVLEGAPLPSDAYAAEVLADGPVAWWRFHDELPTEMGDSSGNGHHGAYGEVNLGEESLIYGGGGAAGFDHVGDFRGEITADAFPTFYPATIETWVKFPRDLTQSHIIIAAQRDYTFRSGLIVAVQTSAGGSPDGELVLDYFGLGGLLRLRGSTRIDDDQIHHIAVVIDGTAVANNKLYVDGTLETTTVVSGTAGGQWEHHRIWTVGNSVDNGAGDFGLGGVLDEAAIYDRDLSAERVAAHYQAGTDALSGEWSGERIERVLALVGVPASLWDIDQGDTRVGPATYGGTSAGAYIDRIVESEQGAFWVNHRDGGRLTFRGRYHRLTATRSTTVQAAFTDADDPDALHVEAGGLTVEPNGIDTVINVVEADWAGGTVTVTDDASVAAYGPQSRSISTEAPTESGAASAGQWLLNRYARPQTRVTGMEIAPDADRRLWVPALELRISDRASLRRHPQQIGAPITNDLYVEGVEHTLANGLSWRTRYRLSKAEPADAAWIWGVSAWGDTTTWG